MAARSFRVTGPAAPASIGRLPDGKFTRGDQAAAPQIVREARERGVDTAKVVAENRAPEHVRPVGSPSTTPAEIPWPAIGPTFNDARKAPFRLT